jgi:CubicO group peptidase (beta-lactamase class C family)
MRSSHPPLHRRLRAGFVAAALLVIISGCTAAGSPSAGSASADSAATATTQVDPPSTAATVTATAAAAGSATGYDSPEAAKIIAAMNAAMTSHQLRAMIVRVTVGGEDIYTGALGESLAGVPATADMHVRNGAVAFTYIGQILAMMADEGIIGLDDKLSEYLPEIPRSEEISLRMLATMTSGYADYVYTQEIMDANGLEPFRQFDTDELIAIGLSQPMMFEPGTNWGYSHTNYAILAKVLEKITGQPMNDVMTEYIFGPMGLTNTAGPLTAEIPSPVLAMYSSERRAALQIPNEVPFYEDAAFWNPSWTTASGAVQTTDIVDLVRSVEVVGSGELVSDEMYAEQVGNNLAGTGGPTPECPKVCKALTTSRSYGMGVVLLNGWITQTKNFSGQGASIGYLPEGEIAIAVVVTYNEAAFDETGSYKNASDKVMTEIAAAVTDIAPVGS